MFVSDELVVSVGLEASSVAGLSNPQLPELQGTGAGVGCETVVSLSGCCCSGCGFDVAWVSEERDEAGTSATGAVGTNSGEPLSSVGPVVEFAARGALACVVCSGA